MLVCRACFQQVDFFSEPCCWQCGRPYRQAAGGNHLCGTCLKQGRNFERARSVLIYKAPIAGAIQRFKYGGSRAGLATFGALLHHADTARLFDEPDLIIPVPLHSRKLRQRGFNQAVLLARCFFPDRQALIDCQALVREKWTPAQTGLGAEQRRRNIRGAFRVARPEHVAGRRILLIDDVYTTGATVDECSRVLLASGAHMVQVLTLARAEENS